MEIDSELLKSIGNKLGLKNKEHIEKSWMQDNLLFFLSKKCDNLIFKGGTALYKFYSLPRFSEDLDFSSNIDIESILEHFCKENNYSLDSKKIKDSRLYKIRFKGILTKSNTIRIDVNLIKSYSSEIKTYISSYPDIPPFIIKIMPLDEMLAEKIHAILNRTKARDLYDVFFILRIIEITEERKKLIFRKLLDRGIVIKEKNMVNRIKKRLDLISPIWNEELKHFVLQELPKFNIVKDFIIEKLNISFK